MATIARRSLLAGAGGSLALPVLNRAAAADAPPAPAKRPNWDRSVFVALAHFA